MPESTKTWEERVHVAVRDVAGQPASDELEAQWSKHATRTAPVVTFFGSYDSGKSTLLKRLVVDAGVTVPDWLTIAARRDTFEVNEVEAMGCLFRDTPGIASGSVEHERTAQQALTITDIILIVLPPQLITGDRETILGVVGGEIFRTGGIQLREALVFAICKMDEGGYDPGDDPHAYSQYVKDKRRELLDILERARLEADPDKIFGIAADPFQTVVNAKDPGRLAYDSFRDWDGLAALQALLSSLPKSLKVLRSLARRRFFYAAAEAHRAALARRIADVDLGLQETKANEERFTLLRQQLDALLKQARSALDAAIQDELLTAARARLDDERAIATFVEPRLEKAVALWRDDQNAELDTLIVSADAEVQARSESRGGSKARRLFEEYAEDRERQTRPGKKVVNSLAEKAQRALRDHHERKLGMKLDKAREELRKLDDAKTFEAYLAQAKRRKVFVSPSEAERARRIVAFHAIVSNAGPLLMELGTLLWEEKQRHDLEMKRKERRQKLRDLIRQKAGEIGDNSWQDWEVRANEFKAWLSQNESAAHAMSEPLEEELRMLNASDEEFTRLLA